MLAIAAVRSVRVSVVKKMKTAFGLAQSLSDALCSYIDVQVRRKTCFHVFTLKLDTCAL